MLRNFMKIIETIPASLIKVFDETESMIIKQLWMSAFCKNKQGINTKEFLWHIFSSGRYPSIAGNKARLEYSKHFAARYFVMPNNNGPVISVQLLPESANYSDYYVSPSNLAWTMAFTHEEGWLGPYFALHTEYQNLNKVNELHKQKLTEIEEAKKNGWY